MQTKAMTDVIADHWISVVLRFRWVVLLFALLMTAVFFSGIKQLSYSPNYRAFFSETNPELINFQDLQATYSKNDNILIVLVPKNGNDIFSKNTLGAAELLTQESWLIPHARRVDSVINFQHTYVEDDDLLIEELFDDLESYSAADIAQRKNIAISEPVLFGQLISNNLDALAINVTLQFPEKSLAEVPESASAARTLRAEVLQKYPDFNIYLTGTAMLNDAYSEAIRKDFIQLIPIMLLIILVTTAIATRSFSMTFSVFITIIMCCIGGLGWAGYVGVVLAGPSPNSVVIILTIAVASAVHLLLGIREQMLTGQDKISAIKLAFQQNFLAISITSLTTIVGFLALNSSDSPPFRDLGNIAAFGIFIAWLLTMTFLPALISILPMKVKVKPAENERVSKFSGIAEFVISKSKFLFVSFGLIALAMVAFIPQNEFSDQFWKYVDERIEFRQDTQATVEKFGIVRVEFPIDSEVENGITDPSYFKEVESFTTWLRDDERVRHVYSMSDIVKRLNRNLNQDDPRFTQVPASKELIAQYLLLYELSLPYGLDLNDRINIDKSATRLSVTLDSRLSTKDIRSFIKDAHARLESEHPSVKAQATGSQVMFTYIAQRNVESMIKGTIIAFVLISVILMFALRSFKLGLLSLVPNGLPILTCFGLWAIFIGEVGLSASTVAVISIGIVIDDTVHFLVKFNRAKTKLGKSPEDSIRYAFRTVGLPMFVNTIILLAGFIVLTFSSMKVNFDLGLMTSFIILLALIFDFFFLPPLLLFLNRSAKVKNFS